MIGEKGKAENMSDWKKYKDHVRETSPIIGNDIDEVEEISAIVGAMIEQRHNLELSQRELAQLCGIPHSSVARIESGKTTPNLSTLLKIFNKLGLSFSVQPTVNIARPIK
ncbi:helix-turn-helix domain-containing protein [Butyrivibrio sp. TB]|jgi:DNA-binding XRE family transcriptional regulator|nr:helix-turn-helix transcriptional regulator [Butyrivibrio sp. TB]